jgi:hypothetical protein
MRWHDLAVIGDAISVRVEPEAQGVEFVSRDLAIVIGVERSKRFISVGPWLSEWSGIIDRWCRGPSTECEVSEELTR